MKQEQLDHIAIVGLAGRFPGAPDLEQFWRNLRDGVESITRLDDRDLLASGVDPSLLATDHYVKASPILDGIEYFDAEFFGFSPREAEVTDPQHRVFLECAWEALENAGYDPNQYGGRIGVFAGAGLHSYYHDYLVTNQKLIETLGELPRFLAVEKDFLSTRVSYRLNLKGPSISLQTACSTSLVAVHFGCQSLLNGESDMVLAGGVSIKLPQTAGYLYQEGTILSPDGHCRAFDAAAAGTIFGSGAGIVILKRLSDALSDGDTIHAVIRGSCINNDGSIKVSYTAPSIEGQAGAISEALAMADVDASEISYVEAHGSGTSLGDPIEVAALTKAFRETTAEMGFCGIGSIKTNVGHLDAAAGVAGLIKTVLSLEHGKLPPSLHFKGPNPSIDFCNSPFFVQSTLSDWKSKNGRRIAGISSFGIGGTNAHVIVEEAPTVHSDAAPKAWEIIPISARTYEALEKATDRLNSHLRSQSELAVSDVAFTLQEGRRAFSHRRAIVAPSIEHAVELLEKRTAKRVHSSRATEKALETVFMFPGQGAQHANMGRELYENESTFRQHIDQCAEYLLPILGLDLRRVLYSHSLDENADAQLKQTRITQPAVFTVSYALAQLWLSWGITPKAMIGHSLGEYVAATLAGVFELEDCLALVAERARLMQQLPPGSMLVVHRAEHHLRSRLNGDISIAAVNAPEVTVLSGPTSAIKDLAQLLAKDGVAVQPLTTSHAFHSSMMDPIIAMFRAVAAAVPKRIPRISIVSTVTADWMTPEQATDANYWAQQIRSSVRFSPALLKALENSEGNLLEVGPGNSLSTLAKLHLKSSQQNRVFHSLPHAKDERSELENLLSTVGALWVSGAPVDWRRLRKNRGQRVPLPTYPFERQRFWIEPARPPAQIFITTEIVEKAQDLLAQASANTNGCREHSQPARNETVDTKPVSTILNISSEMSVEETLTSLWQEALGVSQVDVDDNFFNLGGQSLLALSLITQIGRAFGARFSLASLVGAPTIREFAQIVEKELSLKSAHANGISPSSIQQAVRAFVLENYLSGGDNACANTDSLLENNLIDAMDFLHIAMFLEETYGIRINNDELIGANMGSIHNIASYVAYKLSEQRGRTTRLGPSVLHTGEHAALESAG